VERIYVDPCVFPVSTGGGHGWAVLEAIERIREKFPGIHTICGVSNVSFGLPYRKLLNAVYLVMLMSRGLDSAIIDPCDNHVSANLRAAEALLGADEFCMGYLEAYREGKFT
jgi:5-methyltetrahydrofolate--homocysteine methyltransferase